MIKWFLYSFALMVGFVLAISAAVLIGHRQPITKEIALLHLGDMCELPCWIGITPGKTSVGEARRLIAKIYNDAEPIALDPANGGVNVYSPDGDILWIGLNGRAGSVPSDDMVVTHIFLGIYNPVRLGDVIGVLGSPDAVDTGYACCQGEAVTKQWARIGLTGASMDDFSPRHIFASQLVRSVSLFVVTNEAYYKRWHGFGTYRKDILVEAG
jgi:hypothetical protein